MFENIYGNDIPCAYNIWYEEMYPKFVKAFPDTQFDISPFGMRKEFDYPLGLVIPEYKKDDKILSIGAMDCMLSMYLSNYISDFYAIDLNNGFVKDDWVKSYTKSWGLKYSWSKNAKLFVMNAVHKLGFPDEFFDKVISISVIEHIMTKEYRIKVFQGIQRVLKPGGEVFITVEFNPDKYVGSCHRVGGSIFDLQYLLDILQETDLEVINKLNYDVDWELLKKESVYSKWFRLIEEGFCPAYMHLRKKN